MVLLEQLLNSLKEIFGKLKKNHLDKTMYLIVALNNPGKEYENTPHNIGWDSLKYFCAQQNIDLNDFSLNKKFNSLILKTHIFQTNILLVRPLTFMNNSGQAVQSIKNYYNIDIKNIIVLHDDTAFDLGTIKISQNRNDGGHNGLKSIIQYLKNKDFIRIRIGVNSSLSQYMDKIKFVLHKFNKEESKAQEISIQKASKALELILKYGPIKAQSEINQTSK